MTKEKYLEDLKDIRSIMDRSSRFISLSGISGVVAGMLALIGAYLAHLTILNYENQQLHHDTDILYFGLKLMGIGLGVLVPSLVVAIYLSYKKAKKQSRKFWDGQAKRLVINLFIPLIPGGFISVFFLGHGFIDMIAPMTLVFYGLALVNASKYTLSDIRSLGLFEVALGLIGCAFLGYGLTLWAIGFGILHIVYGIYMHVKYGS